MGWFETVHADSGKRTWWNSFPIMLCGKVVRNTEGSGWHRSTAKVNCGGCKRELTAR